MSVICLPLVCCGAHINMEILLVRLCDSKPKTRHKNIKIRTTHDASGIRQHSGASHRRGSPRCKGGRRCRIAPSLCLGRREQFENASMQEVCGLLVILTIPAGPVARAGSLVAKDAVEPVAVLSALWRIWGVGC